MGRPLVLPYYVALYGPEIVGPQSRLITVSFGICAPLYMLSYTLYMMQISIKVPIFVKKVMGSFKNVT